MKVYSFQTANRNCWCQSSDKLFSLKVNEVSIELPRRFYFVLITSRRTTYGKAINNALVLYNHLPYSARFVW